MPIYGPGDTYVFDDDVLDELENLEATSAFGEEYKVADYPETGAEDEPFLDDIDSWIDENDLG